jgi:hypothetical protein
MEWLLRVNVQAGLGIRSLETRQPVAIYVIVLILVIVRLTCRMIVIVVAVMMVVSNRVVFVDVHMVTTGVTMHEERRAGHGGGHKE